MPSSPDSLILELTRFVPDLYAPRRFLEPLLLRRHGFPRLLALKELGILRPEPSDNCGLCPEPECMNCALAVEQPTEDPTLLFGWCERREDVGPVRLHPEDLSRCSADFEAVALVIARALRLEPQLLREKDGSVTASFFRGYALKLLPGTPACIAVAERRRPISEVLAWKDGGYRILTSKIEELLPEGKGAEEPAEARWTRLLRLFIELRTTTRRVGERQKIIAGQFGMSEKAVREQLEKAANNPAVRKNCGLPTSAATAKYHLKNM